MAPREALECADVTLRDLTGVDIPFGGKVMVLGGDFRQVLPVMPHSTREDIVGHSIKSHRLWVDGYVIVHKLGQNMRARGDAAWRQYLLDIGDGVVPVCDAVSPFVIRIPDDISAPRDWSHHDLFQHVFPDLAAVSQQSVEPNCPVEVRDYFCERAILATTNAVVDDLNAQILKELDSNTHVTYYSVDDVDAATPEEKALWPLDFLHSLTPSGMPPHELTLAPGALVMLLRNLDADAGLCNGVRVIVIHALPRVLDVLLVSGSKAGTRVYIPRLVLAPKNPDLPFVLRRRRFPVKLAWCMTINKAQGQTLQKVGIYLWSRVFSHGQLYVGLSRAGSSESVTVLVMDHDKQGHYEDIPDIPDGICTDNVVWKETLLAEASIPPPSQRETQEPPNNAAHAIVSEEPGIEYPDGTDDVDEFGAAPSHASVDDVVNTRVSPATASAIHASAADLDAIVDGFSAFDTLPDVAHTAKNLEALRRRAVRCGDLPSVWYEISKRTLPEIMEYVRALELASSSGGSSASTS